MAAIASFLGRSLPRRRLLYAALSEAAGVASIALVGAQHKMTQAEAQYQDRPKNGLNCAACALFRPPRSCVVVQGDISPQGWCRFFDLLD